MLWHHLNMRELPQRLRETPTVILPVGAVEEHGPHLPLGLDAMHAWELAQNAAREKPCLAMPPLWYGLCRSSSQHPGTVGISGQTLWALVHDIGVSLWRQGVRHLCILTGHAGGTHGAFLTDAAEALLAETELKIAVACVLDLIDPAEYLECAGDSHAGELETSLAQHLWPELVEGTAPEEYPTFPRFILTRDKLGHWPGGVWGDPALASAPKGARVLEAETRALCRLLEQLERS